MTSLTKSLSFVLMVMLLSTSMSAQFLTKHGRLEIGYGYITRDQAITGIGFLPRNKKLILNDSLKHHLSAVRSKRLFGFYEPTVRYAEAQMSGAVSATYRVSVFPGLSFGCAIAIERQQTGLLINNPDPAIRNMLQIGVVNRTAIAIAPECRVNYKTRTWIRYYGTVGFGHTFVSEVYKGTYSTETDRSGYFAFHLSPIGFRAGRRLCGFAELGFGYKGLLNVGVSYSLRKKQTKLL